MSNEISHKIREALYKFRRQILEVAGGDDSYDDPDQYFVDQFSEAYNTIMTAIGQSQEDKDAAQEEHKKWTEPRQELPPERMFYVSAEMAVTLAEEEVRSFGLPRHPSWRRVSKEWLRLNPGCAVCGTENGCVPHHIYPVHVFPDKELDCLNLITLCPPHHLFIAHLMSWQSWNEDVVQDARAWARKIATRPEKKEP